MPVKLLAAAALIALVCVCRADALPKLIEYGWDTPSPAFIRQNIEQMQKQPFEGVIFRISGADHVFSTKPFDPEKVRQHSADLRSIRWGSFTDNFPVLFSASDEKMSFVDDAHWKIICSNLREVSGLLRDGRCAGVVFDPEPYGGNPWSWKDNYSDKPYEEVARLVRVRGQQFMRALQTSKPDLKLLTFFGISSPLQMGDASDVTKRMEQWQTEQWALLVPFVEGITSVASARAVIDGNEMSYYFTAPAQFTASADTIANKTPQIVTPDLRSAYRRNTQVGMAVYMDQLMATREGGHLSHFMTPRQRLDMVEHNVYWAQRSTGGYVWFYSEKMDWWKDQIPDGLSSAIRSAKRKAASGLPLGFDMAPVVGAAWEKRSRQQ